MVSIQELINEVSSIKRQSEQLTAVVGAANQELGRHTMAVGALVQGSRTGQNAVQALHIASRALSGAGASMAALSRTCGTYIQNLRK